MPYAEQAHLNGLASHLQNQREQLVKEWRAALHHDPELTTPSRLPRAALDDHIPEILRNYERRLRAEHSVRATEVEIEQRKNAALHATNRWGQGYEIREALREWGHLQLVVQGELDSFSEQHPEVPAAAMAKARELLTGLCMEGTTESATKYTRLLQTEANRRVRDLAESLKTLEQMEKERAELLRQAAHDLRGSVGVISTASAVLSKAEIAQADRSRFHGALQRGIGSMAVLLTDLIDLARIEAGGDPPQFKRFDAAARIRETCELMRAVAVEQNLFLKCTGPASLCVEGDPVKLHRILQNLVLNALKATVSGGIVVSWTPASAKEWTMTVRDSGRGFDRKHTEGAAESSAGNSDPLSASEGIGLSIVKRLCNLLDAKVHIDSTAEQGTSFTVKFPLRYSRAP